MAATNMCSNFGSKWSSPLNSKFTRGYTEEVTRPHLATSVMVDPLKLTCRFARTLLHRLSENTSNMLSLSECEY